MADKKATREALGDELTALGGVREDLVVLTADLADATRVEYFRHQLGLGLRQKPDHLPLGLDTRKRDA